MKIKILSVVALFLVISCSDNSTETKASEDSQGSSEEGEGRPDGQYAFSGTINDNLEIMMYVQLEGDEATGAYYYQSQLKEIMLNGSRNGDSLVLTESYNGKITGEFRGVLKDVYYSGVWSGNGKSFQFQVEDIGMEFYIGPLDTEGGEPSFEMQNFEEYINKFEWQALPYTFDELGDYEEANPLGEEWVWSFIDEEYDPEEIGSTYYPFARFNAGEYIGLLVHHHYYPGAFGINNSPIILYTFDNDGNMISEQTIACFCYDSNQAGLYYDAVYPTITIGSPEGEKMVVTVQVDNIYESGTNFPEEVPEDEIIDERSEGQDIFFISKFGDIIADHEAM